MILALLLIQLLAFFAWFSKTKAPALMLPMYYSTVCLYTWLGVGLYGFAKVIPFNFFAEISLADLSQTLACLSAASWAFATSVLFTEKKRSQCNATTTNDGTASNVLVKLAAKRKLISYVIATILLLHIAVGGDHIYQRQGYLVGEGGSATARILLALVVPFVSFILAFGRNRLLNWFLLSVLFCWIAALSSRSLALIPFFFLIGAIFNAHRLPVFQTPILVVFILIGLALPLSARNNEVQGLIPNLTFLLSGEFSVDFIIDAINYATSYSVGVTALSIRSPVEWNQILASISPIPSALLNIELLETLKLNRHAPMSAAGVLFSSNIFTALLYYFMTGIFWAVALRIANGKSGFIKLAITSLFLIFTLFSLQYGLRAITRLTYYSVFLLIIVGLLAKLRDVLLMLQRSERASDN